MKCLSFFTSIAVGITLTTTSWFAPVLAYPSSQLTSQQNIAQFSLTNLMQMLANAVESRRLEISDYALSQARSISNGYNIEWREAVPEIVWNQGYPYLKINLLGKMPIPILRDKDVRLSLNFAPDNNFQFRYAGYDLNVSRCGKGRPICRKMLKKAKATIERAINERQGDMEATINSKVGQMINLPYSYIPDSFSIQKSMGVLAKHF